MMMYIKTKEGKTVIEFIGDSEIKFYRIIDSRLFTITVNKSVDTITVSEVARLVRLEDDLFKSLADQSLDE